MDNFKQFFKYVIVGGLAFVIDFSVLVFLREFVFVQNTPFITTICSTISFTVAFIFNYIVSLRFVFKNYVSKSPRLDFIYTLVIAIIGLLLTILLMYGIEYILLINYMIAKIIVTGVVLIWNFIARKVFVFK